MTPTTNFQILAFISLTQIIGWLYSSNSSFDRVRTGGQVLNLVLEPLTNRVFKNVNLNIGAWLFVFENANSSSSIATSPSNVIANYFENISSVAYDSRVFAAAVGKSSITFLEIYRKQLGRSITVNEVSSVTIGLHFIFKIWSFTYNNESLPNIIFGQSWFKMLPEAKYALKNCPSASKFGQWQNFVKSGHTGCKSLETTLNVLDFLCSFALLFQTNFARVQLAYLLKVFGLLMIYII